MKELINIQRDLRAPKGQYNTFGKYRYRSAEDILNAVKPLLADNGCTLTMSDDIVLCGSFVYVKATATLVNTKGDEVTTTAYAREPISKKGMDESQVTGSTSSYARKYALNGLFCIDDTKDVDAVNDHKSEALPPEVQQAISAVNAAKSRDELVGIWNAHRTIQADPSFAQAVKNMGAQFKQA